ncbi:MAG TPA: ABC transporter permease [Stellaceae bacterium]|nr:ABC transporter permease [Stellaceae bacterium]
MKLGPGTARVGVIILLLILWELGARLFGDPLFMSPPSDVVVSLVGLIGNGPVMRALQTTLYELVTAFLMAIVVGVPLGLVLGLQRFARGSFYPIVVMLYAIPQATILPLMILAFGIGPESKIAFGFTHSVFPIVIAVVAGVQDVKPTLLTCARSMGASRFQTFMNVILPHMIPSLFTGMRVAMTGDLLGVLLAELYVSQAGVGHYTRLFTESFQPAKLFALVAALAAIAVVLNELCRRAERRMSRWRA